ncbi:ArnT family glycosyltransferase [Kitasatospora sp. NPDC052896]|uniref:ArnT family glycosyltransferase n=1 Tax=Kitasatospora sp. NPDC052896 TaxID=3364061 RepID=UPI0037C7C7C6
MFWRSPVDQPRWARPALLVIATLAAVLYAWNISSSGFAPFYSDAVKSMSVSWKALLFGAMDPGATITPDKIAGSFVPQALSARIFGFHAWSVTLPQCVEGVLSVLVMYRVVRRWAGPRAGLAAAGLFTFTPVVASMFGHSMEDGALVCCLVLAADCYQRAVLDGRLRWLVLAGVWVGVGFQAKMMQAWMVLPALAIGYLVAAPVRLRRRFGHLLVAGAVCLAVSLSWVAMMTVVPAKDRPYVDGSTNNSAVAMVFGYNGLERFGIHVPGSIPSMGSGMGGGGAHGSGGAGRPVGQRPEGGQLPGGGAGFGAGAGAGFGGGGAGAGAGFGGGGAGFGAGAAPGAGTAPQGLAGGAPAHAGGQGGGFGGMNDGPSWLKLFQGRFGPQIGWMYPLALLALAFGLWTRRRAERTDRLRGGFVLWGSWLLVIGAVFTDMSSIPHTAYMSTLAPALAALCGAGAVLMWDAYREGRRAAWALPVAVAAEAGWSWYLSTFDPTFLPWLKWLMLGASVLGVVAMVWGRATRRTRSRLLTVGLLAGLAGAVVTPVAWSSSVLDPKYAGSALDAGAGPSTGMGAMFKGVADNSRVEGILGEPGKQGGAQPGGAGAFGGLGGSATLTSDQRALYDYVKSHQDGAKYVLAVDNWSSASPYILATGDTVLPMGGFSGSVPQPSLSGFTTMVHAGQVRFVLVQGGRGMSALFGGGAGDGSVTQIDSWVKQNCTEVPSTSYGVNPPPSQAGGTRSPGLAGLAGMFGGSATGTLYGCTPSS